MSTSDATTGPSLPAPLWRIGWDDGSLPQELNTAFPQAGEPYDEWTIRFTTRSGSRGFVKVPASKYSADEVAARIDPVAQEMEAVHTLQSKQ